jgi:hypothetical protein
MMKRYLICISLIGLQLCSWAQSTEQDAEHQPYAGPIYVQSSARANPLTLRYERKIIDGLQHHQIFLENSQIRLAMRPTVEWKEKAETDSSLTLTALYFPDVRFSLFHYTGTGFLPNNTPKAFMGYLAGLRNRYGNRLIEQTSPDELALVQPPPLPLNEPYAHITYTYRSGDAQTSLIQVSEYFVFLASGDLIMARYSASAKYFAAFYPSFSDLWFNLYVVEE